MIRHWRIRHNNKDEYVMTKDDDEGNQLDQVLRYCVSQRYGLAEVLVIETATDRCHKKLSDIVKEYINRKLK